MCKVESFVLSGDINYEQDTNWAVSRVLTVENIVDDEHLFALFSFYVQIGQQCVLKKNFTRKAKQIVLSNSQEDFISTFAAVKFYSPCLQERLKTRGFGGKNDIINCINCCKLNVCLPPLGLIYSFLDLLIFNQNKTDPFFNHLNSTNALEQAVAVVEITDNMNLFLDSNDAKELRRTLNLMYVKCVLVFIEKKRRSIPFFLTDFNQKNSVLRVFLNHCNDSFSVSFDLIEFQEFINELNSQTKIFSDCDRPASKNGDSIERDEKPSVENVPEYNNSTLGSMSSPKNINITTPNECGSSDKFLNGTEKPKRKRKKASDVSNKTDGFDKNGIPTSPTCNDKPTPKTNRKKKTALPSGENSFLVESSSNSSSGAKKDFAAGNKAVTSSPPFAHFEQSARETCQESGIFVDENPSFVNELSENSKSYKSDDINQLKIANCDVNNTMLLSSVDKSHCAKVSSSNETNDLVKVVGSYSHTYIDGNLKESTCPEEINYDQFDERELANVGSSTESKSINTNSFNNPNDDIKLHGTVLNSLNKNESNENQLNKNNSNGQLCSSAVLVVDKKKRKRKKSGDDINNNSKPRSSDHQSQNLIPEENATKKKRKKKTNITVDESLNEGSKEIKDYITEKSGRHKNSTEINRNLIANFNMTKNVEEIPNADSREISSVVNVDSLNKKNTQENPQNVLQEDLYPTRTCLLGGKSSNNLASDSSKKKIKKSEITELISDEDGTDEECRSVLGSNSLFPHGEQKAIKSQNNHDRDTRDTKYSLEHQSPSNCEQKSVINSMEGLTDLKNKRKSPKIKKQNCTESLISNNGGVITNVIADKDNLKLRRMSSISKKDIITTIVEYDGDTENMVTPKSFEKTPNFLYLHSSESPSKQSADDILSKRKKSLKLSKSDSQLLRSTEKCFEDNSPVGKLNPRDIWITTSNVSDSIFSNNP